MLELVSLGTYSFFAVVCVGSCVYECASVRTSMSMRPRNCYDSRVLSPFKVVTSGS